jgi:GDP/UDP-N,N'-diacetylbacillosamine 2-epimerase (hydrolysing)
MKKICVISGARSEYGQLRWIMQGIKDDPELHLQVVVTGMHLSPEFGLTYLDIERDGFFIDKKLETLLSSDTAAGVSKSVGLGTIAFADAFFDLKPDIILLLGDRFEAFAAATAAMISGIPIAHVHGGEVTQGAIDDVIRHALTKMSFWHFVAAEEYRQRVIQLGESPKRVFLCGGLGVDVIKRIPLLDRDTLEASLGFSFGERNLLITFHPVTLAQDGGIGQMDELLAALDSLKNTHFIITFPNADVGGREMTRMVEQFVTEHPNAKAFTSLGQQRYLSCLAQVDAVVGNSSSGLTEAPSFMKATVNIGERQLGRLRAKSVIDCPPTRMDIKAAVEKLYTPVFQTILQTVQNPYGGGGASDLVVETLRKLDSYKNVKKIFYDASIRTDV